LSADTGIPEFVVTPFTQFDHPRGGAIMIRTVIGVTVLAFVIFALALVNTPQANEQPSGSVNVPDNPAIQFGGFVEFAGELTALREAHRIPVDTFLAMAKEPDTIILDTRSQAAYESIHLANAIHLNFSDFTDEKLRETIPSRQTRILIYCNNNFADDTTEAAAESDEVESVKQNNQPVPPNSFANKRPTLALNIPTYINLHGYGYKNVYELADYLQLSDTRISFEGNSVTRAEL
jgi:hypothetical protein